MKLLFDQNLSPRLIGLVGDVFPGSVHVRLLGLQTASDDEIWACAAQSGLAIVSKDSDFRQRSFLYGPPPKVIWIRLGNCATDRIAALLWTRHAEIRRFCEDPAAAFLALG